MNTRPCQLITYNEAAALLGVSVRTVRRYVASGVLASRRLSAKTVLVKYPFRDKRGALFSR
ncbi:MAG: helix-turn-helix domain-containing protein [Kiritimatiellae bacterium]|nr:helix-turn-helix domain-containing protein [Kiritimatiellia bacterium]